MVDHKIIEAFQMMWGNFPEGVMLVDKSKNIVAVNAAYESTGLKAGMVCAKIGSPEMHKGCLANQALTDQTAKYKKVNMNGREFTTFWVPVAGKGNLYLHFSVGMMVDYGNCAERIEGSL